MDFKSELEKGNNGSIAGFGTFKISERSAREGRNPQTGETIQIAASKNVSFKAGSALKEIVKTSLGSLRCRLARILDLIKPGDYKMLWVTDFPSFEYSEEEGRYMACHHPFTSPKDEDVDKLLTDKANCYSKAYDIVINGYEAGGGSIRIHDEKVQETMFKALELTDEDIQNKFGFFVEALKYGTPPHMGMGLGLERIIMLLANTDNIRDVVAFPKIQSAVDMMNDAPSFVNECLHPSWISAVAG